MPMVGSNSFRSLLKLPLACLFAKTKEVSSIRATSEPSVNCGDLITQAEREISQIRSSIYQQGYQFTQIMRTEVNLSHRVNDDQLDDLYKLIEQFPGEIEVNINSGFGLSDDQSAQEQLITIEVMLLH